MSSCPGKLYAVNSCGIDHQIDHRTLNSTLDSRVSLYKEPSVLSTYCLWVARRIGFQTIFGTLIGTLALSQMQVERNQVCSPLCNQGICKKEKSVREHGSSVVGLFLCLNRPTLLASIILVANSHFDIYFETKERIGGLYYNSKA